MKKNTEIWTVSKLQENFARITFPEYQREPNVWSRDAKQRLIDSMLRQFDISSFYFYMNEDKSIDCVDGRQRIGAIMSFLGENPHDSDNKFELKVLNEIYKDSGPPYPGLEEIEFENNLNSVDLDKLFKLFKSYKLTIVELSKSKEAKEFNLQFARLNLGTIINSGEKLHAMVGALRNACFTDIGSHPFLQSTRVQTRRYSREQLAAQILAQIFSLNSESKEYARTRHFDLQRLFKDNTSLDDKQKEWIEETRQLMDLLAPEFEDSPALKSRALVVSTVLLAYEQRIDTQEKAANLEKFIGQFFCRLKWQIQKGLDVDDEYRYLITFQTHIMQGSVEKPSVKARAEMLKEAFLYWTEKGYHRGDEEYIHKNPGRTPQKDCEQQLNVRS